MVRQIFDFTVRMLRCPAVVLIGIVTASAFSVVAALVAEVVFGLEPCILCIYQRGPFVTAIFIGSIGLYYHFVKKNPVMVRWVSLIAGLNFLTNANIALYHSGVEQKWWRSAVEGCAVPNFGDEPQNILENILSAPTARCDEISWADPVFGLTMANYNVVWCLGLFAVCVISFVLQGRKG